MEEGNNQREPLRPLLPVPTRSLPPGPPNRHVLPPDSRRSRGQAGSPCAACRKRKSKCNAARPKCRTCILKSTECIYDENAVETRQQALSRMNKLETEKNIYEEIYGFLQSRPRPEANSILDRIRTSANPESVLRTVRDGDLLLQLSLVPETRLRYQPPHGSEMPSFLLETRNPYFESQIYEFVFPDAPRAGIRQSGQHGPETSAQSSQSQGQGQDKSPYMKPYHTATIIDPMLEAVEPSKWTAVSSDDALMRRLIRSYFMCEFQWSVPFNKDYLLADMWAGRRRFCSPLLVNAILAYGSMVDPLVPARSEFWNPDSLLYRFLAETRRLWELKQRKPHITTVQASIIITVLYAALAADKLGSAYAERGLAMAHELQLFDAASEVQSPAMRRVRENTAWAFFLMQSHNSYYMFLPPALANPPAPPPPDPSADPEWYGDFMLKYAGDERLWPSHFPQYLYARHQFQCIINDVALTLFHQPGARALPSIDLLYSTYHRLLDWYQGLPPCLTPRNIFTPSHLKLHIQYYNVLINLFEAAIRVQEEDSMEWSALWTIPNSPQDILSAAKTSMETVIRLYYLRHGFGFCDCMIIHGLMVLAGLTMRELLEKRKSGTPEPAQLEDLRSSLALAAKGISEQGNYQYVARAISRVFDGGLDPNDKALVDSVMHQSDRIDGETIKSSQVHTQIPVYIVSLAQDPEEQRLPNMLKQLSLDKGSSESSGVGTPADVGQSGETEG